MKLLLDTDLLLWAAGDPKRLSRKARTLIEAKGNTLLLQCGELLTADARVAHYPAPVRAV